MKNNIINIKYQREKTLLYNNNIIEQHQLLLISHKSKTTEKQQLSLYSTSLTTDFGTLAALVYNENFLKLFSFTVKRLQSQS